MTSTTPPASAHLAALVAGLTAYRGSVSARQVQATTPAVRADLDRRATEEEVVLRALLHAAGRDAALLEPAVR